jgi:hypothetical protein
MVIDGKAIRYWPARNEAERRQLFDRRLCMLDATHSRLPDEMISSSTHISTLMCDLGTVNTNARCDRFAFPGNPSPGTEEPET